MQQWRSLSWTFFICHVLFNIFYCYSTSILLKFFPGLSTQPSSDVLSKQVDHPPTDSCNNSLNHTLNEKTQKSTSESNQIQNLDCASRNLLIKETGNDNITSVTSFSQQKGLSCQRNALHQNYKKDQEKKSRECRCKGTVAVDSNTVLTVLLIHSDVCEYHKDIGQALQAYITRVRWLFPSFYRPFWVQ